jgi:hypothetical protein
MIEPADSGSPQDSPSTSLGRTRELALSAAWHGGLSRSLVTVGGTPLTVVFRGNWSHGFGPDFADAMIRFGEHDLRTGGVEIHRRASDWMQHGHHLDPRYNDVILHVVSRLDTAEVRRLDGAIVPAVVLDIPDEVLFAIDQELPDIWDRLGGSVCADHLALREPARILSALNRLGDLRFSGRVTRFEGDLTVDTLESVLWRGVFDGFGFTENREPMRRLCAAMEETGALSRIGLAQPAVRWQVAAGFLFGLGGYLPFSPADATLARIEPVAQVGVEAAWSVHGAALAPWVMPATSWTRGRSRPANHPASRLAALANLLATSGGDLVPVILDRLRSGARVDDALRDLSRSDVHAGIGSPRAIAITASVILPLMMGYAHHSGDHALEDAVSHAWSRLPKSEWSRPARRALAQAAGDVPVGPIGERANQGLLYLDRNLCTPRRCYECPIAAEVIRDRQRHSVEPEGVD